MLLCRPRPMQGLEAGDGALRALGGNPGVVTAPMRPLAP